MKEQRETFLSTTAKLSLNQWLHYDLKNPFFKTFFSKENWVTCTMCGKSSRCSPDISVSEALVAPSSAAISCRDQKHSPGLRLPPGHALFGPLGVRRQVVDQLPADLVGGLERFVLLCTDTAGNECCLGGKKGELWILGVIKKNCDLFVYDGRHQKKRELKVYYGRRRTCKSWIHFLFLALNVRLQTCSTSKL